jgi:uncharacterized protein (DUF427 family)
MVTHARNPEHRIDVETGSQQVKVIVGGQVIAETSRPKLLHEGRLPTRYYIPPEDVRRDLLQPSDTSTSCPYKGAASHWSAKIGDQEFKDVAWSYENPLPEREDIRGHVAFYNERVEMTIDGEKQERPQTRWS